MKDTHPFWQYRHGDSRKPRPEHEALDRMVLPADDPWWDRNYPPNGWGCQCYVTGLTEGQVQRKGLAVSSGKDLPDAAADPHWQYAPGKEEVTWPAASPQGKPTDQNRPVIIEHEPAHVLDKKTVADYISEGRDLPENLVPCPTNTKLLDKDATDVVAELKKLMGGNKQQVLTFKCGEWDIPAVVDAESLGGHLSGKDKQNRIPYLPLLFDDMLEPQEIWAQFTRVQVYEKIPVEVATRGGKRIDYQRGKFLREGKLSLRYKMLASMEVGDGKTILLVCETNERGILEAMTFFPADNAKTQRYINETMRVGRLIATKGDA